MNTTQRKFALDRIYTILCKKLDQIEETDKAMLNEYREKTTFSLNRFFEVEHTLAVKQEAYNYTNPAELTLDQLFDLTSLKKEARDSYAMSEDPRNASLTIYMVNPTDTSTYPSRASISLYFNSNIDRANKVIAALKSASDEIMLGDNSEALKAIQDIEARQF